MSKAKPPPMHNDLPFIMIDDERIIVERRKTLRDFLDNSDFSSDMRLTSEYLNEVLKSLIGETTTPTSPHS